MTAAREAQRRSRPATVESGRLCSRRPRACCCAARARQLRRHSVASLPRHLQGLKGCKEADGAGVCRALREGVAAAYNAVVKPADEGTIPGAVSRLAAERAVNAAEGATASSTSSSRPSPRARSRARADD
ncbi:MAG: hypothetical protein ACLRSD_05810 [Oscillibacter sp.]